MQKLFNIPFRLGRMKCQILAVSISAARPAGSPKRAYYQHNHSSYELHYAKQGTYKLSLGRAEHQIPAGQVVLIPPGAYHQIQDMSPDLQKMDLTFEIAPPAPLHEDMAEARLLNAFGQFSHFAIDDGAALNSLKQTLEQISLLAEHYDEEPYFHRERLRAQAALLLLDLYAKLDLTARTPVKASPVPKSMNATIDEFFSFNYNASRSSSALAGQLHVGVRQLNRILQQMYGMSYREKLNEVRLEVATNFLTTTTKSIAEISELLGYGSPANFSTFIKKETGRTPSEIRLLPEDQLQSVQRANV